MSNNQIFKKPINEIIKKRVSVRSYKTEPLEEEAKKELLSFISGLKGPFNSKVRFNLVDSRPLMKNTDIKIGTYGIVKGASSFFVSSVEEGELNLEELGYEFEKLILFSTSLGLGTCWLGGTFKKGEFAKAIGLKEGEILPTVSPVGIPSENRSLVDSLMRMAAGSKNRKPFNEVFFNNNFSKKLTPADAGIYAEALEMLRLAPSASNKQPWRVVKENDNFHFYLSHTRGYSKALGFDMQRIDIGIALCHFHLSLIEKGIGGSFSKSKPSIESPDDNIEYIITWTNNMR